MPSFDQNQDPRPQFEALIDQIPADQQKKLQMKMYDNVTRPGTLDSVFHVLDVCDGDFLEGAEVGNFVHMGVLAVVNSLDVTDMKRLVSFLRDKNIVSNAKLMTYANIMNRYMKLHENLQFKSGKQRTELNNEVTAAAKTLDSQAYELLKNCVISKGHIDGKSFLTSVTNCDIFIKAFDGEKWAKEFQVFVKSGARAKEIKEEHLQNLQRENADPSAPAAKRQKIG